MNFIIYLVNEGLSKVLPFITIFIVAKYVDVESFGQLTLYYITLEILTILINNNIRATTRIDFFQLSLERYIETKSAHNISSFFLMIAVLFICLFINIIEFKYLFLLALIAFMRGVIYFVLSDLQCKENAKIFGFYNIIPILLSNILFISAILSKYSIESWFYSIFFGTIIQFLFVIKYIKANKLFQINNIYNFQDIYNEFKHGLIFMPQAIGFWVNAATDRILISMILGNTIVGSYMFVFQLATPIVIFSSVVNLYLTPKINKYLGGNSIHHIKIILVKFLFYLLIFSLFNYFVINFVINNWYYEKYAISLEYVPFIVISLFFQATYLIFMNVFYYIGQKKFISLLVFFVSISNLAIICIGLSLFGMVGLLYSNIFINFFVLLFVMIKLNKSLFNVTC